MKKLTKLTMLAFVLVACGGRVLDEPTACVAPTTSRACDAGGVILFFDESTDDAGVLRGTMSSCTSTCPVGTACTFATNDGYADGVCE